MSWNKKDLISDIRRNKYDIDIQLPYSELLKEYKCKRATRSYVAGVRGCNEKPPKPSEINFNISTEPQCVLCGADLKWNGAQYECTKCDYKGMNHTTPDSEIKEWTFAITDSDDILHLLQGHTFTGTKQEAVSEFKKIAYDWEQTTGKWCYLFMLHSIGTKNTK